VEEEGHEHQFSVPESISAETEKNDRKAKPDQTTARDRPQLCLSEAELISPVF
jgi:hypothetical protein